MICTLSQTVFCTVNLEDKGRKGLVSGLFPQLRCFSLSALVKSTWFDKTKLYQFWRWLSKNDNIVGKLGVQERIANIKAGKNMLGVSLDH